MGKYTIRVIVVLDNRYIPRGKSTWTIRRKGVGWDFPLNGHITCICWNAYLWGQFRYSLPMWEWSLVGSRSSRVWLLSYNEKGYLTQSLLNVSFCNSLYQRYRDSMYKLCTLILMNSWFKTCLPYYLEMSENLTY